jgi:histidine ammonia-lyase
MAGHVAQRRLGEPLPTAIVRAALAVRLNGIARGGSGAAVEVAETLAAMLNAGVHPLVPETPRSAHPTSVRWQEWLKLR